MEMKYTVHSVAVDQMPVKAVYGGREVVATLPGLTVELVNETHCHTFRFVPEGSDDMDAYKTLFVVGAKIAATFARWE